MANEYLGLVHSVDELAALIDHDRLAAADMVASSFAYDVAASVATITEISAIASARVSADMQVASAKILTDAEVTAASLLASAEMFVAEYRQKMSRPAAKGASAASEAVFRKIGKSQVDQLSNTAKQSVEAIEREAANAILKIKNIGSNAIDNINDLVETVSLRTQEAAAIAAEKLETYRHDPHTLEEMAVEADAAARVVAAASENASSSLRAEVNAALLNIRAVTDEACRSIQSAAEAAKTRIDFALEKASGRVQAAISGQIWG